MTRDHDADLIAEKLRGVTPDILNTAAFSVREDGIRPFHFWTSRLVTTDEMVSICRDLAAVIRREIPERPDGWAASIYAGNVPAVTMVIYFIGWAGRPDEWQLVEGRERKATDHVDWQTFRERLRVAAATLGTEGERTDDGSDFHVSDTEDEPLEQVLCVHNPEFLTKELIVAIQNVLKDGIADGVVTVRTFFGEDFDVIWEGIEVRADGVEDIWDRNEAEQLLGDRLKI